MRHTSIPSMILDAKNCNSKNARYSESRARWMCLAPTASASDLATVMCLASFRNGTSDLTNCGFAEPIIDNAHVERTLLRNI